MQIARRRDVPDKDLRSFRRAATWYTVGGVKPDPPRDKGNPHAHVLEYVERKQRNTLWPDAMVNSSSVDALLWKGSPKATKLQRVGIAIWGLTFLSLGAFFVFVLASEQHSLMAAVIGLFGLALGTRITFNAFRRAPKLKGRNTAK